MTEYLRTKAKVNPHVFVWPYGEANGIAIEELKKLGYDMFFTLESGLANASQLDSIPRVLIANNPSLKEFAQKIITVQEKSPQRIMHIDLDYVYDENRQQMDRNIDVLIQRVKDMQISTVYLQAFADPDGDGLVKEVWFPNRLLPMKADIFSRVASAITYPRRCKHLCVDAGIKLGFRSHINASKILTNWGEKSTNSS